MPQEITVNLDDGSQKVWLDDEHTRFFKWYPNDINFADRLIRFQAHVETLTEKLKGIKGPDGYETGFIENLGEEFGIEFDKAFGAGVCQSVFGILNPISPTPSGGLVYENFLEAIAPLIEKSFEGFGASREKHLAGLRKKKGKK